MIKIQFPKRAPGQRPTVVIEAEGYTGPGCEQATARLRNAIGQTIADEKKPEYFDGDQPQDQIQTEGS